ncbi:MAG: AMP-binding protein [Rhodospirillales bacterium]|nr:AMP-binding protein [Rhodospirillales bacterium]
MDDFYDDLETRSADARAAALFRDLPNQIANAKDNTAYYASLFRSVDPESIGDQESLATLPVTRKSDLIRLHQERPPFGGLATAAPGRLRRVFQSPGPIYDAEGAGPDYWRTARAFHAAGFRAGGVIHNAFAYHLTPAGAMVEAGAEALGCAVFPAGTGSTDLQVRAIVDLRPAYFTGTPSFLKVLLTRGLEAGADLSSLGNASVAGEALPASLRGELRTLGVRVTQWYAADDLGLIAYESEAADGLIVDEGVIVEIVRPGSGQPVPHGEVGEVVVTTFTREYPLIRFATGDLSAVLSGQSACGRTNMRLRGWLGRADQTTKVRGMFVHPSQVADVMKRHPELLRARLVVDSHQGNDTMTLRCESVGVDATSVEQTVQALCKLRARVEIVPPGTLANDGKIIDDIRGREDTGD